MYVSLECIYYADDVALLSVPITPCNLCISDIFSVLPDFWLFSFIVFVGCKTRTRASSIKVQFRVYNMCCSTLFVT